MAWRIYYDDGTTSDNCVTDPWRVVCVVQPRPVTGREIIRMYPYYLLLTDNRWRPCEDATSLVQQIVYNIADIDTVVTGIWTSDENFEAITQRARMDEIPGIPPRAADDKDNRR